MNMSDEENNQIGSSPTGEDCYELERVRWEGKAETPVGRTPFGFFDADAQFVAFAPRAADWAARRLGYPIVDVELVDHNFYSCFEESVTEYSAQINQFNIKQNINSIQGMSTSTNFTNTLLNVQPLPFYLRLSEAYGAEVGTGGNVDWRRASLEVKTGVSTYNLDDVFDVYHVDPVTNKKYPEPIEVKRIFHYPRPTPAVDTTTHSLAAEFGWQGHIAPSTYLLTPVNETLMRMQAVEFNDMVRRSGYSFEIVNNKLTLFPIPTHDYTLWFDYIFESERDIASLQGDVDPLMYESGSSSSNVELQTGKYPQRPPAETPGTITDMSNAPYQFHSFSTINDVGKRWIMKYYLALCKEMLGLIRSKYDSVPVPDGEVSLDGDTLRSEAEQEKERLIEELREDLEQSSKLNTSEAMSQISEHTTESLKKVPMFIYVG